MQALQDQTAIKLARDLAENTEHAKEEKKLFAETHGKDAKMPESRLLKLDKGVSHGIGAFEHGVEAKEAFEKKHYLAGGKQTAKAGADALGFAEMWTDNKYVKAAGDGMNVVSKGFSAAENFKEGEYLKGTGDVFSGLKSGAAVAKDLGVKGAGRVGGAFGAVTEGIEGYESYKKGEYVEMLEHGAATVSNGAKCFGPAGKSVELVADSLEAGLKVGDRGNKFAAELGLLGKDKDGKAKDFSDVAEEHGTQVHNQVHDLLGNNTFSDIASHAAGGGTVLMDSIGGGVLAGGLGLAGYAKDGYTAAKGGLHKAKDVASGAYDTASDVAHTTYDAVGDVAHRGYDKASDFAHGAYDKVADVAGSAYGNLTDVAHGAYDKVGNVASKLWHGLF
jgi:hypothetical protein